MASEKPVAFTPGELAQRLSASAQKLITAEQVTEIAETGNLLSGDGTVDLVRYLAFLNGMFSNDAE
ncbi:MAG TPA: hypothetical protein DEB39_16010 [Planctomycetaceae bacterium]|nr:hypothetical protein [Planctomycetaceae bacterium]